MGLIGAILTSPLALTFRPDLAAGVTVFMVAAIAAAALKRRSAYLGMLAVATLALAYWWSLPVPFTDPMGQMLFIAQRVGATLIFTIVVLVGTFLLVRRPRVAAAQETN